MRLLIGYLTQVHETNLLLYAIVTVLSVGLTGVTVGGLATGLVNVLDERSGRVEGGA